MRLNMTTTENEEMDCLNRTDREQEAGTSTKRMRIDPPSGPSCYNIFCKDLSSQGNMKNLSAKERFTKYSEAWASLEDETREEYAHKAATLSLSNVEKERQWKKNLKKITRLVQYQQILFPSTEGFFVLSHTPDDPHFGGTEAGLSFKNNNDVVEDFEKSLSTQDRAPQPSTRISPKQIRDLFNSKYSAALGKSGCRMPYKKINVRMDGLPDELVLRPPSQYGRAQLRKIWESRDSLICVITQQD